MVRVGEDLVNGFCADIQTLLTSNSPFLLTGTSWEYTKSMKRFGVPTDWLPTTQANGTARNNYHKQWIAIREAKERPNFEGIECPDSHDILLGELDCNFWSYGCFMTPVKFLSDHLLCLDDSTQGGVRCFNFTKETFPSEKTSSGSDIRSSRQPQASNRKTWS